MLKDRVEREGNVFRITKKVIKVKNNEVICRCLHGKCMTPRCIPVPIDHVFKPQAEPERKAEPD